MLCPLSGADWTMKCIAKGVCPSGERSTFVYFLKASTNLLWKTAGFSSCPYWTSFTFSKLTGFTVRFFVLSTTNWCLPRALPVTEQQRHLPSASTEMEARAARAADLQARESRWREALFAPGNLVGQVFR